MLRTRRPVRGVWFAARLGWLALAGAAAADDVSQTRMAELRHLLAHDCGSCHGMRLTGGLGPPLTPAALAGKPSIALERVIALGRPGTPMPPWGAILSEEETRWLVEQLKSGGAPSP